MGATRLWPPRRRGREVRDAIYQGHVPTRVLRGDSGNGHRGGAGLRSRLARTSQRRQSASSSVGRRCPRCSQAHGFRPGKCPSRHCRRGGIACGWQAPTSRRAKRFASSRSTGFERPTKQRAQTVSRAPGRNDGRLTGPRGREDCNSSRAATPHARFARAVKAQEPYRSLRLEQWNSRGNSPTRVPPEPPGGVLVPRREGPQRRRGYFS